MSSTSITPRFLPGLANGPIRCLHAEPGGGVLLGGRFDRVLGVERGNIAKLLPDGRLAPVFASVAGGMGPVLAMAQDEYGRMATGGWGSSLAPALVRFAPDGSPEPGPMLGTVHVSALAWASEGRLLLGLKETGGAGRLVLLDPAGFPVPCFDEEEGFACEDPGIKATIRAISCQGDGTLLVGGRFDACHGARCPGMVRMGLNGRVDTGFNAELPHGGAVVGIHPLADGSIIVHVFVDAARGRCHRLFRLHADGRLDTRFPVEAFLEGEVACVSAADGVLHIAEVVQVRHGRVQSRIRRCMPTDTGTPVLLTVIEGMVRAMVPTSDGGVLMAADLPGQDGRVGHGLVRVPGASPAEQ